MKKTALLFICFLSILVGCKKEPEVVTYSNNNIPQYDGVSTLLIENYVNRVFIDLIGREPTDAEMEAEVASLEAGSLSMTVRTSLVDKLMTATQPIPGDSSYSHAYAQKFYDDNKSRFLDGMSEGEVQEQYYLYYYIAQQDSAAGNMLASELNKEQSNRVLDVMNSKWQFRAGNITNDEMCRRMCYNVMYDDLHMGSFNFINASFDDLFYRFPTEAELDEAYEPIEQVPSDDDPDLTGYLFGENFSNKAEYLSTLTGASEFSEGMIRWAYLGLLSREPTTAEIYSMQSIYANGHNIRAIQKSILISDEYAGF
jgi:hypothetical protein